MAGGHLGNVLRRLRGLLGEEAGGPTDGELLRRYVSARDEAAFEALLRRHGPMVLGVCRRLLAGAQDVDDAFQATFLVLVRKARSIRDGERLGNWLYGVAYRVAVRARGQAARRHARRRELADVPAGAAPDETARQELRALLDEELARLPHKYRTAVVCCDLEGNTHEEAARLLGWPKGTVSTRLNRARALLRARLGRRGLALSAGGLAGALGAAPAEGALPIALVAATTHTAARAVAGAALPERAAALADGVLRELFRRKVKAVAALLLALALAAGGGALAVGARPAPPGQPAQKAGPAAAPGAEAPPAPRVWKEQAVLEGHAKEVTLVAFAPDGKALASRAMDGTVKLWDVAGGKERASLTGRAGSALGLAYAPDGKTLLTVSEEGLVKPRDPDKGKERSAARLGLRDAVLSGVFSPDGKVLATTAGNLVEQRASYEVQLWDVPTGKKRALLKGDDGGGGPSFGGNVLAFSPDGKVLVTSGNQLDFSGGGDSKDIPEVKLWDLSKRKELVTLPQATAVAFAPDGKVLAVVVLDKKDPKRLACSVKLLDAATRKEQVALPAQAARVMALAFSPDGKLLATGGGDKAVRVWDTATGKEVAALTGHKGYVAGLAFSPDGKTLASASADHTVRLWVGSEK